MQEMLAHWSVEAVDNLKDARPAIPTLDDRAAEGWEPLLAIADSAGGEWPERARKAALALSVGDGRDDDSLGVRLLREIQQVFESQHTDRLASSSLIEALLEMEEAPWGDLRGKPLDARMLARLLRPYEVRPQTIRLDDETAKGYLKETFSDAWRRYTPQGAVTRVTAVTNSPPESNLAGVNVTDVTDVTDNPGVPTHRDGTDSSQCVICDSLSGYSDNGTGERFCWNHGPIWTTARHGGT